VAVKNMLFFLIKLSDNFCCRILIDKGFKVVKSFLGLPLRVYPKFRLCWVVEKGAKLKFFRLYIIFGEAIARTGDRE
jgi:hypothetical protein